jgi:hypothetical protein
LKFIFYLFIFVGVGEVNGLRLAKILKLQLGGLHVKHTEQRGIWVILSICSGTKENHGKT